MAVRARGEARREEILEATVELVSERGHQAVRVADVAARLSVSAGLVMYHFGTKEELLAAAFASAAEKDLAVARSIVEAAPDPLARLVAIIEWYLPTQQSSRSWKVWLDGWAASQFDESLGVVVRGLDDAWRVLFGDALAGCAETGDAAIENVAEEAEQLAAFLNGLVVRSLTGARVLEHAQLAMWVRRFLMRQYGIPGAKLGLDTGE